MDLPIVFQSEQGVVVDKPAGWLSVPSRMGRADPRPCVGPRLEEQLGRRLWPVHRLDEEVSGLLLFALSADAHRRLCQAFEAHRVEKTYLALAEGSPPPDAALGEVRRWTTTLLRGKRRAYVHPAGKPAVTDATLLAVTPAGLLFALRPRTGRAHQLRVELARRGCPIVGDSLYGARQPWPEPGGIALRAVALSFAEVPDRGALGLPARIEAPPTPAFAAIAASAAAAGATAG